MNQTQVIDLSIVPGNVPEIIHVKQYDSGRTIKATIFDETNAMNLTDTAYVAFVFQRSDGSSVVIHEDIAFSVTTDSATVTLTLPQEVTEIAGRGRAEIAFYSENRIYLASADFAVDVERSVAVGAPAAQEIDRRYGESPGISNIHRISGVEVPADILERVLGNEGGDWEAATLDVNNSDGTSRRVYEFTKLNLATKEDVEGWFTVERYEDDYVKQLIEGTLEMINCPTLTKIGYDALTGLSNLHTIILHNVSEISAEACRTSVLSHVKIYILGKTVPTLGETHTLPLPSSDFGLFVQPDMVDVYKSLPEWSHWHSYIYPITKIPSIPEQNSEVFRSIIDRTITNITHLKVTRVNNYVFNKCQNLRAANFPNAEYIGSGAFRDCISLAEASFPKVTMIGSWAFENCISLVSAYLPEAINVGSRTFYNCSSLTSAYFSKAEVFNLENFGNCRSLTSVYVLTSWVPVYSPLMFSSCPLVTVYVLPDMVDAFKAVWNNSIRNHIQPYYGEE